jgi:fructose-bisphosphate aldolase class II/tagatose 1,6-diphosphate aldolase GatY/KbaY
VAGLLIVQLQQKLKQAQQNGSAILAANFYNFETLRGILEAAAETSQPVILQLSQGSIEYMGLNTAVGMARAAMTDYGVETWLHLDHASSVELIEKCLDCGFESVMIDASEKPVEDNIRITRFVVERAKAYQANVEAELGYIAKLGQSAQKEGFTKPEQAKQFVNHTGVDALAVAIGSAHGFYKEEPKLDLERLSRIRQATDVCLVLHGGSGITDSDLKESIHRGICKINIATETKDIFMKTAKRVLKKSDEIDPRTVFPPAIAAVRDLIKHKLTLMHS